MISNIGTRRSYAFFAAPNRRHYNSLHAIELVTSQYGVRKHSPTKLHKDAAYFLTQGSEALQPDNVSFNFKKNVESLCLTSIHYAAMISEKSAICMDAHLVHKKQVMSIRTLRLP